MATFREVVFLPAFEKDLKKLSKRYRTLDDDLDAFIETELKLFHKLGIDHGWIVRVSGLDLDSPKVYKARRFACKALKGKGSKTGIRVIYAHFEDDDRIELVEMYFKGDKENEDRARIRTHYLE